MDICSHGSYYASGSLMLFLFHLLLAHRVQSDEKITEDLSKCISVFNNWNLLDSVQDSLRESQSSVNIFNPQWFSCNPNIDLYIESYKDLTRVDVNKLSEEKMLSNSKNMMSNLTNWELLIGIKLEDGKEVTSDVLPENMGDLYAVEEKNLLLGFTDVSTISKNFQLEATFIYKDPQKYYGEGCKRLSRLYLRLSVE